MSPIILAVAIIFSPIAGIMAGLITFEEYSHHYPDRKKPLQLALEAGLVASAVFFVISIIAGYFITLIVTTSR